jgi:hypothetical protein
MFGFRSTTEVGEKESTISRPSTRPSLKMGLERTVENRHGQLRDGFTYES